MTIARLIRRVPQGSTHPGAQGSVGPMARRTVSPTLRSMAGVALPLTMVALVAPATATATSAANECSQWSDTSCWRIENQGTQPAVVQCDGEQYGTWIEPTVVPPGGTRVHRLNLGWGDGMGFPEPNVGVRCQAVVGSQSASLELRSLGWGDRVHLKVEASRFSATQFESWGSSLSRTTTAPFEATPSSP